MDLPFERMNVEYGTDLSAKSHYYAEIRIEKPIADKLEEMMNMNRLSIEETYGYEKGAILTFNTKFSDDMEVEVCLAICEEDDFPYAEAILLDHGRAVAHTEPCFIHKYEQTMI